MQECEIHTFSIHYVIFYKKKVTAQHKNFTKQKKIISVYFKLVHQIKKRYKNAALLVKSFTVNL